ncbi:PLAT/LH2 domain-containing protein [Bacilliculturomica massiliensis]|uniref:PLAT/LH2 domain-containing protein n=1 Tax=Bacilliculturomica massiliensis TaxID=1917867 RepID=UPI001030DF02|nr:PLAT/LH2 domain-containing protein [Bacilliculturomica massiliensis]
MKGKEAGSWKRRLLPICLALVLVFGSAAPAGLFSQAEAGTAVYGAETMPVPVLDWNFDQASNGTVPDASGNGRAGTIVNGTLTQDGQRGQVLDLNGTSAYVSGKGPDGLEQATIAMWVKERSYPAGGSLRSLFSCNGWTQRLVHIHRSGKGLNWDLNGASPAAESAMPASSEDLNQWVHYAFTYDKNAKKLLAYKNGELVKTIDLSAVQTLNLDGGFSLGAWRNGSNMERFSDMQVDEVALYDRALTQEQLRQLYSSAGAGNANSNSSVNSTSGASSAEARLQNGEYLRLGGMIWRVIDASSQNETMLLAENCPAAMLYADTNNIWDTSRVCAYLNGEFLKRFGEQEQQVLINGQWNTYVDGGASPTETGRYTVGVPSKTELEAAAAAVGADVKKCSQNYWIRTRVSGDNSKGMLALADGSGYETLKTNTQGSRWSDAGVRPMICVNAARMLLGGSGTSADPYTMTGVGEAPQLQTPNYRIIVKTGAELFGARATDRYTKEAFDLKLKLIGSKGEGDWFTINPFGEKGEKPAAGSETAYAIATRDVGAVERIQYRAAGSASTADWYITSITVGQQDAKGAVTNEASFQVHQWALNSYESTISLGSEYTMTVKTGNVALAGTDSNIYVRLIGDYGTTDEVKINPSFSGNAFEKGKTDQADVLFNCDVGKVKEIQVRSDMRWAGADWYPDWIKVKQKGGSQETTFQIGEWIADKNTRIFTTVPRNSTQYKLTVTTGSDLGAGTDSDIYVKLIGTNGETAEREISELYAGNAFERDTTHEVIVNFDKNIGTMQKIMVRSDMSWVGADWKLSKIKAEPIVNGEVMPGTEFIADEWINDTQWRTYAGEPRDASESREYRLTVKTSNSDTFAGTDADIYVKLIGSSGTTEERELTGLYSGNAFEKGTTHTVTAKFDKNIGTIRQLQLRSDMSGVGPDWLVESIQVDPIFQNQVQSGGTTFVMKEWITDKNWHTFSVDASAITQYQFTIKTTDKFLAGTDSNIYVQLVGDKGITNEREFNELISGNAFERGDTDQVTITFNNAIGTLQKIRIRSDMKWAGADWHLSWIKVQPMLNGSPYGASKTFQFNQWIDTTNVYEKQ